MTSEELHSMGGGPGKLKDVGISVEEFEKARKALKDADMKDDEKLYLHYSGALIASGPRGTRILSGMPLEASRKLTDAFK